MFLHAFDIGVPLRREGLRGDGEMRTEVGLVMEGLVYISITVLVAGEIHPTQAAHSLYRSLASTIPAQLPSYRKMHITNILAVLAAASVAEAALTYNITKALTKENYKKYKCLCVTSAFFSLFLAA